LIVLLNKLDNIVKVVHVLADHEGGVTCLDFLVMLERVAARLNGLPSPSFIGEVAKIVLGANEHGNGDVALDVGEVD